MKSVAVMQPYFFPYARYFRLFAEVDEFVMLDDVQFPRRGRVHRTQVPGPNGKVEWLTLPLAKQPVSTQIRDRRFSDNARATFDARLARLPWIADASGPVADRIRAYLYSELDSPLDYVERGLRLVTDILGLHATISRSSDIVCDGGLRSEALIIEKVKAIGGTHYVNLPGGRGIYHEDAFEKAGLHLSFLPSYEGPHFCMLHSLITLSPRDILL